MATLRTGIVYLVVILCSGLTSAVPVSNLGLTPLTTALKTGDDSGALAATTEKGDDSSATVLTPALSDDSQPLDVPSTADILGDLTDDITLGELDSLVDDDKLEADDVNDDVNNDVSELAEDLFDDFNEAREDLIGDDLTNGDLDDLLDDSDDDKVEKEDTDDVTESQASKPAVKKFMEQFKDAMENFQDMAQENINLGEMGDDFDQDDLTNGDLDDLLDESDDKEEMDENEKDDVFDDADEVEDDGIQVTNPAFKNLMEHFNDAMENLQENSQEQRSNVGITKMKEIIDDFDHDDLTNGDLDELLDERDDDDDDDDENDDLFDGADESENDDSLFQKVMEQIKDVKENLQEKKADSSEVRRLAEEFNPLASRAFVDDDGELAVDLSDQEMDDLLDGVDDDVETDDDDVATFDALLENFKEKQEELAENRLEVGGLEADDIIDDVLETDEKDDDDDDDDDIGTIQKSDIVERLGDMYDNALEKRKEMISDHLEKVMGDGHELDDLHDDDEDDDEAEEIEIDDDQSVLGTMKEGMHDMFENIRETTKDQIDAVKDTVNSGFSRFSAILDRFRGRTDDEENEDANEDDDEDLEDRVEALKERMGLSSDKDQDDDMVNGGGVSSRIAALRERMQKLSSSDNIEKDDMESDDDVSDRLEALRARMQQATDNIKDAFEDHMEALTDNENDDDDDEEEEATYSDVIQDRLASIRERYEDLTENEHTESDDVNDDVGERGYFADQSDVLSRFRQKLSRGRSSVMSFFNRNQEPREETCPAYPVEIKDNVITVTTDNGCEIVIKLTGSSSGQVTIQRRGSDDRR